MTMYAMYFSVNNNTLKLREKSFLHLWFFINIFKQIDDTLS